MQRARTIRHRSIGCQSVVPGELACWSFKGSAYSGGYSEFLAALLNLTEQLGFPNGHNMYYACMTSCSPYMYMYSSIFCKAKPGMGVIRLQRCPTATGQVLAKAAHCACTIVCV